MTTKTEKFGFIRTTMANWAANLFPNRAGIVTDSPNGGDAWGWFDGSAWSYSARRGASESFAAVSLTALTAYSLPRLDANKKTVASAVSDDGINITITRTLNLPLGLNAKSAVFAGSVTTNGGLNVPTGQASYHQGTAVAHFGSATWVDNTIAIRNAGKSKLDGDVLCGRTVTQWSTELVTSGCYIKTSDTTIGPSAAAKASLLDGGVAAGGFAAVTDPANRWNTVGAKSKTELLGVISSTTNQILTFELYRNGSSVATLTTPARTYGTNTPWRLSIKQTVRVAGASGTVRVLMRVYCTADNANSTASCYATEVTLTGVDLIASHTWDVVCTIPNNASNSITCQDAEKVG